MIAFLLAVAPLLLILVGITVFRQSGLRMAFVGWFAALVLAVGYFHTSLEVALVASAIGFLKSFGIAVSVVATMYMIFLMATTGALEVISERVKQAVAGAENQALYIGVGFGSFLTSLGVVTPSLFPPLLVVMGFTPFCAVAIAVLGYNASTSFALLSIPVTLPAEAFGFSAATLAYKISLYLPVVSVGLAFALLWLLGGRAGMRRGAVAALIVGLALAVGCLGLTAVNVWRGTEVVPVRVVGALAGLFAMLALQLYDRWQRSHGPRPGHEDTTQSSQLTMSGSGGGCAGQDDPPSEAASQSTVRMRPRLSLWQALSPWLILTVLAIVISLPAINTRLASLPGRLEELRFYRNQVVDLNLLAAIYTAIAASTLLSLPFLRPTKAQLAQTSRTWLQRAWGPFFAYAVYFCIAYIMQFSAMEVVEGELVKSSFFPTYNMNVVVGSTLAAMFGAAYVVVAAWLGLFGAVVGGSEASSNVMFYPIQKEAATAIGLDDKAFMTLYGAHAVAGGVASAVTPAKVNNAVSTIRAGTEVESAVMRKLLVVAVLLTLVTGVLTLLFIQWGL